MGTLQQAGPAAYRITPAGRAACAPGHALVDSPYHLDLLDLLRSNGRGMRQRELRQFMPPASLEQSILALLERGLIESECGAKTSS